MAPDSARLRFQWVRVPDLAGDFITFRIALDPHRGRTAFALQTLPSGDEWPARVRTLERIR